MTVKRPRPAKTSIQNIVVLTGAGVSQESGLETFRASDGTWAKVKVEDVATPEAFVRDPSRVHDFYNARRRRLSFVEPNAAHIALAKLQRAWNGAVTIVTQNVDDLHERAGASVFHMHGELLKARCLSCDGISACNDDLSLTAACSLCGAPGRMRPDIVWFGEMPMYMDAIMAALKNSDLFVSIGTSGMVYPAAGFVQIASRAGAYTLELNLDESLGASSFDEGIYGPASKVVTEFVDELLSATKSDPAFRVATPGLPG